MARSALKAMLSLSVAWPEFELKAVLSLYEAWPESDCKMLLAVLAVTPILTLHSAAAKLTHTKM